MTRQYFLMYSYYIQSYTLKDFYIENDFEFTFNMMNHIYKTTYAVNLLNQNNIIHNDLHMGNILIHMKNLSPIIIDFGLSFNINNCYKLNKNYIDFQYVKKFVFDFRTDSYHFNIEKRFISFIIYNIGIDFVESIKNLKLGIACSFVLATIFKTVYMILNQNKFTSILEKT